MLAPLAAVLLFLAAIVAAFGYLRLEEVEREQEAVKRDLEYAQQRLRLRLLERQEQLMRLARDISNKEMDPEEFMARAEALVEQYPELQAITWIDASAGSSPARSRPASRRKSVGGRSNSSSRAIPRHVRTGTRPAAAGVLATSGQHADHAAAATAHAADGARALRRRDPGRILDRQPSAVRRCRQRSRPSTPSPCSTAATTCWPAAPFPSARTAWDFCPGPPTSTKTKCRCLRSATD
jgi:hypothetical protein